MKLNKGIKQILEEVKNQKLDTFVVFNHEGSGQPGTRYLSGFSGSESIIIITLKSRLLITDGRYYGQAKEEARRFRLIKTTGSSYHAEFQKVIGQLKVRRILVDDTCTLASAVMYYKKYIPRISFAGEPHLLQKLRIVKDVSEIAYLRKAAHIAMRAFGRLLPHIKAGVSERYIAAQLEFLMKAEGADHASFETIVASGVRGAMPHAVASDKKIRRGEFVTIDFGAFYKGYASDTTRTIAIGKVPSKLREIYDVVQESQRAGCVFARSGVSGSELDAACRSIIESKGYGKYFVHGTGHGLGMEVHELPIVNPGSGEPMPVGAIITCEPGIYIDGLGGVRIEDALVLKKNGAINLSGVLQRELIVLK